jgi:uroporphyrinogen III methyltransferase / synthase
VLVARGAEARDLLPEALRERGAEVDVVALYETVAEEPDPAALEAIGNADYLTFTSSSTVRNFLDAVGDAVPRDAGVISIGPVTSASLREAGLEPDAEAERHDIEGLIAALLAEAASG